MIDSPGGYTTFLGLTVIGHKYLLMYNWGGIIITDTNDCIALVSYLGDNLGRSKAYHLLN